MTYAGYAVIALAGAAVARLWPLSAAVPSSDAFRARLYAVIVTGVICTAIAVLKRGSTTVWTALAIAAGAAGLATLLVHSSANFSCVADFVGQPMIIGRVLLPHAQEYVARNPGTSPSDLLLGAGGVPGRVWTPASIRSCRFWVSWGGLSAIPMLAGCLCAALARRRYRFDIRPARPATPSAPMTFDPQFDAFLSYRHVDSDKDRACEILEALEAEGLRVAIDFRDFRPNEHFLSEMERCIKESRFILCVVTSHYLDSDHCIEEALISRTLDLAERRRRLVPLIFDRVELPVWLHGLVGIDFTQSSGIDPQQRLSALLKQPTVPVQDHVR